jgi:beta-ureidopropionase / N-carbamoyl-L-amino-acid hydrolase
MSTAPLSLTQLNTASWDDALHMLHGIYEHSPWVAARALAQRPFSTLAALKFTLACVVTEATVDEQLGLIRAHPELAGKAMVSQSLTAESTHEQSQAGLTHCTAPEFAQLQQLNADYNAKFGWPFILAVRGPRGTGLSRSQIIATFTRRLAHHADYERAECLRQIHRIAELRINDVFSQQPVQGHQLWDWQEALAAHSEPDYQARGQLTVTYLSDAHRACAAQLEREMRAAGFDSVHTDAVGNVVARYESDSFLRSKDVGYRLKTSKNTAKTLLTGSHYDTVRNGGKYDGRLGIYTPLLCVQRLHSAGTRLPFAIELVAFAEEEGQRFPATFLASSALVGKFNTAWLQQTDAQGTTLQAAMEHAGLQLQDIASLQRDPAQYLGYVEVHVEQGPVLCELNLPLGVVTSINGSLRLRCAVIGMASHAGTTPMNRRRDAAAAVAELSVYIEQRAALDGDSVATIGMLQVPAGSVNVVPGRCEFSLDMRAPTDAQRDALATDVLAQLQAICQRRGVSYEANEIMRAAAAPSDAAWQARWERAVAACGLPVHRMPSGAGHDAMQLHTTMPQAMLFVRGENAGISHNPLESSTSCDMQLACDALEHLLRELAQEMA